MINYDFLVKFNFLTLRDKEDNNLSMVTLRD